MGFERCFTPKMVIWKEREHELHDTQATNDPINVRDLRECELLKYFRIPGMRAYVLLSEYLIQMWDPNQQHFQVSTHIFTIDVRDIYLLTRISGRGSPMVLIGPKGGEMSS